jgi:hypothetical protein
VIDREDLWRCEGQAGDGEVVDPVGEGCVRRHALGALQGRDDGAEMGDDDDVGCQSMQPIKRRPGAGGQVIPAFTAGGADVAGAFPEGADVVGGFGLDLGEGAGFPVTEVDFAQARIMRQSGARAKGGRWAIRRERAATSDRSAGRSVQPTMVFAWVGPWRTSQNRVMRGILAGFLSTGSAAGGGAKRCGG